MAKKEDLAKDLSLGRGNRKNLKKSIDTTEEGAKEVVKKVVKPKVEAERVIRTTMDLPQSVHRAIKMKSAADGISLKDYIVGLVKADLNLD